MGPHFGDPPRMEVPAIIRDSGASPAGIEMVIAIMRADNAGAAGEASPLSEPPALNHS
jgi:hypothetical protein